MKLYNSMTRKKEEFVPIEPGKVKMYSCGPTVYNFFHIGNARPFIIFDTLRRYFEYRGYEVQFVQNFTDIDDKVINKANAEGVTYDVIADRYIKEYFTDAKGLGIRPATVHPRATETMDAIIDIVKKLVDNGHAYAAPNGDVYFRTKSFPEYGKLSHQPLDELQAGARISVGELKEDPMDFAVWKAAKPGEPSWESPWGQGRPGWHIECSAMVNKYLGKTIDIHSGGKDLIFPHHENEIAQSECANGCTFANYWLHNGFLTIDNEKMSKSKGNFFMVREAAEVYGYETIRMFMLSAQYRSPLNYSEESLMMAKNSLARLYTAAENLQFLLDHQTGDTMTEAEQAKADSFDQYRQKFIDAMDDDLNTADALAAIFELVREINTAVKDPACTHAFVQACFERMMELCGVLGLVDHLEKKTIDSEIEDLIAQRTAAKKAKNFAEADRIRDYLLNEKGIIIKDTRQGTQWSYKE
ncbi:cysteine--tRNA ligase [Butyricicoccus porcorum]|uniref:Cysteine--tRNA ligase n=1 Tax=Butyricicoccus porcorum TaxID=1945634 RepID=A0A252F3N2_9FIRM|nr:cysteine--tRNA ligase [Butyricicoccus porcorum]MCI6925776.1 cysteine--tRNA ligase [Butyricicoccus porcorum]MDD6985858.1 cysteine--tRNA ligase [Butyricicoccus porcorum]MDY4483042.1 cysteine--tRNA ligase [Butyricicoccus porcorum]OUM20404.1 cysteine--tRNA ligase [Butyricicoccus porcorum]